MDKKILERFCGSLRSEMKKKVPAPILRLCGLVCIFILAAVAYGPAQDAWINEVEFAPFIVMPEELLYRIIDGDEGLYIVDIRPREAWEKIHIVRAAHFRWDPSGGTGEAAALPRDREIMIVSEDGEASFDLLKILLRSGYSDVWVVEGGMKNWPYREYLETGGDSSGAGASQD